MGTGDILSAGDQADVLVAFYQHSYESHINRCGRAACCIYDTDHVTPNPDDRRFTAIGVPDHRARRSRPWAAPSKDKGKNLFVLGLLARIFSLDVAKLTALITERFGGRSEDIVRNAMLAFDAGYATPADNLRDCFFRFDGAARAPPGAPRSRWTATWRSTYGLIAAGVRYGAGYPITPWSTVMETLRTRAAQVRRHLRPGRGRAGARSATRSGSPTPATSP